MTTGYHGKTVLITGASSGIGASFARAFAARGANLVLAARSREKLQALSHELSQAHRITATVIPVDLTAPDGPETLYRRTQEANLAVDVLVNNAGFAAHGVFEAIPLERQLEEISLNVSALVEVTHRFLPAMVARGRGAIINVSSTAAFQPVPYMAVYGASKAFVLSFSEALYEENRERGITVLALCPGSTETPFFDVVGAAEASFGRRATPEAVVATALAGLERRRSYVVDGLSNRLLAELPRLLPRALAARISGNVTRPRPTSVTQTR